MYAVIAMTKGTKSKKIILSVFASQDDADAAVTQLLSVSSFTKFEIVTALEVPHVTFTKGNADFMLGEF